MGEAMTVYVCPIKDIECGDHTVGWCAECPKRGRVDELRKVLEALEGVAQLRASIKTWALCNAIPGWQNEDTLFAACAAAIAIVRAELDAPDAVLVEREACANLCEVLYANRFRNPGAGDDEVISPADCAAAIRERR
jgi:hypothetical protein